MNKVLICQSPAHHPSFPGCTQGPSSLAQQQVLPFNGFIARVDRRGERRKAMLNYLDLSFVDRKKEAANGS
jgi:hypothetical protein